MDKFQQYKLNLEQKQKDLILSYLSKINQFILKYDLDKELYKDIEEMVFEKLSLENQLDQFKIKKILNEVGEPETIFSDYIEENQKKDSKKDIFYDKLITSGWQRDNENAIFLGISKILSEKIGMPIWGVRGLFIFFTFFVGFGLSLYLILGLLLPIKSQNYEGMTMFKYIIFQLKRTIKDGAYNLSRSFLSLIRYVFGKFYFIFMFCMKNILPVLRVIFFGIIGINLLSIVFGILVVLSFTISGFSFENIDFTSVLPWYFNYALIFGVISFSIFSVFCFVFAFNKKIINKYVLVGGFVSLLLSIFLGISSGINLFQKYISTSQNKQVVYSEELPVGSGSFIVDFKGLSPNKHIRINGNGSIKFLNSTGSTLKIEVENSILGDEELAKKVFSGLDELVLKKEGNTILLESKNKKIFSKKVPFTFLTRNINILVPEGLSLEVANNDGFYIENAFIDKKYDKYRDFVGSDCQHSKIYYSKEEGSFVCDMNKDNLESAKKQYLQDYLVKNFEKISSLKHNSKYKREYYNENGNVGDWKIDDFNWIDEKSLEFYFRDRSLDIKAFLNIEDTQSGVVLTNFAIKDVNVDDTMFDKKYYEDLSGISSYLDN